MTALRALAIALVFWGAVMAAMFVWWAFLSGGKMPLPVALILGGCVGAGIGWIAGQVIVAILRWEPDEP